MAGWIRNIRDSRSFVFIMLSDGTFFEPLQIVYHDTMENFAEISHCNVGAALIVRGTLVATPQARQPFELQAKQIEKNMRSALRKRQRTPAGPKNPLADRLLSLVRSALTDAADELVRTKGEEFTLVPLNPVRVIVALSGGRDSMALLDVTSRLFAEKNQSLIARVTGVYVNHGLSPNAKAWEAHCRKACEERGVAFEALTVRVNPKGDGVEAAARDARYRALSACARKCGDDVILTAHHEDDRLETFLIQWVRGAGPEGLAAFPKSRDLGGLGSLAPLGSRENVWAEGATVLLLRPWCEVLRRDIERYARAEKLTWIEDEANENPRFLRNRIRHEVIPLLETIRPGFRQAAARSVSLMAETVEVLRSVAASDLEACRSERDPSALNLFRLLHLIPARQAWCLRAWMHESGMRPPSKARLDEALRQVRETQTDSAFSIRVSGKEMRRWGADLIIRDVPERTTASPREAEIRWRGEDSLALPAWNGELFFLPCEADEPGVARERLLASKLTLQTRRGGEKLKLWPLRPSKNLKDLYTEANIPAFERQDLPLLWMNGELLFAAGLGLEIREADDAVLHPDRVRFFFRTNALLESEDRRNLAELSPEERRNRARERRAEAELQKREEKRRAQIVRAASGRRRKKQPGH